MKSYTVKRRLLLGGTNYGERLVREFVKHPEMTEVLTTTVVSTGEEGGYAADLQIVYRADREISWNELASTAQHVQLYEVTEEMREIIAQYEKRFDHE